jgi:hypothetical protein
VDADHVSGPAAARHAELLDADPQAGALEAARDEPLRTRLGGAGGGPRAPGGELRGELVRARCGGDEQREAG